MRIAAALLAAATCLSALAQTSEADRVLELRRAQLNERQSEAMKTQKQRLFEQGLLSKSELDAAAADLERARIDTERARVQLANELPSFRIVSATKSIGSAGEIVASVRLTELERGYGAATRRSYLISLKSGDAIISVPYQKQLVVAGRPGQAFDLRFQLLRDTDQVTVSILSGTRREEVPILFERGADGRLHIACANDSQTAALGARADFALDIERFGAGAVNYDLRVTALPAGYTWQWLDADTKATVANLHFDQIQAARKLVLQVFVPERLDAAALQQPIAFRVEAGNAANVAGSIALQLRPTAAPKLVIGTDNLFLQLAPGEVASVPMRLENAGGTTAHNVALEATAGPGMTVELQPALVPAVGAKSTAPVTMRVSAARSVVNGEYAFKVQAHSSGQFGTADSQEVTFRVEIRSPVMHGWILLPVFGLLGACAWGVYWVARAIRK